MNNLKLVVLLALLTGLLITAGKAFGGTGGMMLMFVVSMGINFFSYWYSDKIVLKMYDSREVDIHTAPELVGMVANLARRAGMPMPRVYIIDTDAPNAFATGRDPEHAAVAVTSSLMRALTPQELEGVMAHELAHVKNRDTLISTLVASLAGAISMLANMAQWAAIFGAGRGNDEEDGGGGLIGSLFMIILAPMAAMLIQMGISRSREFLADETGAKMAGNPLALASALRKIEHYAMHRTMPQATPATSHMFIVNPFAGSGTWMLSLFSTHPPTDARVQKLQALAGSGAFRTS
ncbi:MAG: zinc metalloprotease HtpX [Negativicutes bacterium]|nr:zinc metalloprotease HtpX [Negativicutes bacterium]